MGRGRGALVGGVVATLGHVVGEPVKLGPEFKGSARSMALTPTLSSAARSSR